MSVFESRIIAEVSLKSMSPYSQSRPHQEPAYENENPGDYDKRTWQSHLHVENGFVVLPGKALYTAICDAAQYSMRKIVGNFTWTKKFESGIVIFENPSLGIRPEDVGFIDVYCDSKGKRNGSSRVMRRYPQIPEWQMTFDIHVIDPIITEDMLSEMIGMAGLYKGIGRYRPENRGTNGRFELKNMVWQADRKFAA
jgi:hypothetical protein